MGWLRDSSINRLTFGEQVEAGSILVQTGLRLLVRHPKLLVYPALATVAALGFTMAVFAPLLGIWNRGDLAIFLQEMGEGHRFLTLLDPVVLLGIVVVGVVSTFIGTFFMAGMVYSTKRLFDGESVSIKAGLHAAWRCRMAILVWSIVNTFLGVFLQLIGDEFWPLSVVSNLIFSVTWAIGTFFIVPVIVLSESGPQEMFQESAKTFVDIWGETITGGLGIGLIVMFYTILAMVGVLLAWATVQEFFPIVGLDILVVFLFICCVSGYFVASAIGGTVKTAMYIYAIEGREIETFSDFDLATLNGAIDG